MSYHSYLREAWWVTLCSATVSRLWWRGYSSPWNPDFETKCTEGESSNCQIWHTACILRTVTDIRIFRPDVLDHYIHRLHKNHTHTHWHVHTRKQYTWRPRNRWCQDIGVITTIFVFSVTLSTLNASLVFPINRTIRYVAAQSLRCHWQVDGKV